MCCTVDRKASLEVIAEHKGRGRKTITVYKKLSKAINTYWTPYRSYLVKPGQVIEAKCKRYMPKEGDVYMGGRVTSGGVHVYLYKPTWLKPGQLTLKILVPISDFIGCDLSKREAVLRKLKLPKKIENDIKS